MVMAEDPTICLLQTAEPRVGSILLLRAQVSSRNSLTETPTNHILPALWA